MENGTRVQMHPATDRWMRGDRFGTVIGRGRAGWFRVRLDRSGQTVRVAPQNVIPFA